MNPLNHEKFIPLNNLNAYPGSPFLDRVEQIAWTANPARRVWLFAPQGAPVVHIDEAVLQPQQIHAGPPRWVDYGVADMPFMAEEYSRWEGFVPVRLQGVSAAECAGACLVLTTRLDQSLASRTLEEAQRLLWGMAQADAGSTSLRPARLEAGRGGDFEVVYTAGPPGLPAGALVRFALPKVFDFPQTDAAGAPGYTQIAHADSPVAIVDIRDMAESHEKAVIVCRLEGDMPAGGRIILRYRTARSFICPIVLDEVEMRAWCSNLAPLTPSVALSGDAPFVNMLPTKGHSFAVVPGPSERLHLFLPGRRYASEKLSLRGLFTDRYRNVPPSGPIDADFELWLAEAEGGERPLGRPGGRFTARHRFELPLPALAPGVYRAFACRPGGAELARSNPLEIIADGSGERLYWGEFHSHTEIGDGVGDYAGVYRHAREEGSLEFATVSEHAEYFTENQWEWMQDVINAWNDPGRFVTLVGYENIGLQRDRCVYTSHPRLPLVSGFSRAGRTLDKVWARFHGDDQVVGGPHATRVHETRWEHHDPDVERFIEIYSMWGACDFRHGPLVAPWIRPERGPTANDILLTGAKLGFTAGGDCHDGRVGFTSEDPDGEGVTPHSNAFILLYRCGMTAANMPQLDRRDLVQAIRNRRTFATTGARLLLDWSVSGLPMGAIGQAEAADCRAVVHAVSPLERVEIVRDGNVVWNQPVAGLEAEVRWLDPEPLTAESYYYLHVVQQDGQQAWASPIWVSPPA